MRTDEERRLIKTVPEILMPGTKLGFELYLNIDKLIELSLHGYHPRSKQKQNYPWARIYNQAFRLIVNQIWAQQQPTFFPVTLVRHFIAATSAVYNDITLTMGKYTLTLNSQTEIEMEPSEYHALAWLDREGLYDWQQAIQNNKQWSLKRKFILKYESEEESENA